MLKRLCGVRVTRCTGCPVPSLCRPLSSKTTAKNAEELAIDDADSPLRLKTSFELEQVDRDIFRAHNLLRGLKFRKAIYGGQVIGHALRAAEETVEEEKSPHSMHCYFLNSGITEKPITYIVDRIRDGRSFATRSVRAIQDGHNLFLTQISFHKNEDNGMQHSLKMPVVPPPEELLPYQEVLRKAIEEDEALPEEDRLPSTFRLITEYKLQATPPTFHAVYENRPVNQSISALNVQQPRIKNFVWIKTRVAYGRSQELQRQLAAYISDGLMMEFSMYPHIARGYVPSMVYSLDHAIWFHRPEFCLDEWCLYEMIHDYAGGCRTYSTSRLWTRDGQLILTASQEGLSRTAEGGKASVILYPEQCSSCLP